MKNHSFDEILEENKERIYRLCRIYAVEPIAPQDLFQEVIYQVWKSLSEFKGNSQLSTWIYRIALNVCISSKLKLQKKREKMIRLESIQFNLVEDSVDNNQKEKLGILQSCISTLNEADKSIIVLYLEDLSYREISNITGLTENHIAVKMKRIRTKLFNCMNSKSE